jgi:uncharacterized protein
MRRLIIMLGIILSVATQANSQEETPASNPQTGETIAAPPPKPLSPIEKKKRHANATVVTQLASSLTETDARFAEDIRDEINGFGRDGVRVMPILGNGGQQNLEDLLLLTGIDMAIVGEAHVEELKSSNPDLYGKIHNVVRYIAKLYDAELHILARAPLTKLDELRGKRVSFNLRNSQAHIVGKHLFQMAGLDCEIAYYDNHQALEAMKEGKLDAHLIVSGAPQPFLANLDAGAGINLVPVTEQDIAGGEARSLYERYLPGALTHDQYPDLIKVGEAVPTIATRTLLAVYKWPKGSFRYQRIEHFVKLFFDRSGELGNGARHAKWREMNLAAEVPGWTRFLAASEWLAKHNAKAGPAADNPRETKIREQFEKFLARHEQLSGEKVKTDEESETLYRRFKQFIAFQDARVDE